MLKFLIERNLLPIIAGISFFTNLQTKNLPTIIDKTVVMVQ